MSAEPPPLPAAVELSSDETPEGELAQFFGYSYDVLAILDADGGVLMISPSVERVLGYPVGEMIGEPPMRWVHPDDQENVREQGNTVLAGQAIPDMDVRILHADGSWVPMRWSLVLGPRRRVYAVGRDRSSEVRHRKARLRQEMAELRLRTTMELHDGILQTLTGASLQIEVARRVLRSNPERAEAVLRALGESVAAEQREMRLYVDEVKGGGPAWADGSLALSDRIETIIDRVGMIWGVTTAVEADVSSEVSPELARQVLRVIQEATVNAARHGSARSVAVVVTQVATEITISVTDDGSGFSFIGDFDHHTLKEKRLGPLSLKHRVEEARGRIHIRSTAEGATITVHLPVSGEDVQ